jgi:hypothetical protein
LALCGIQGAADAYGQRKSQMRTIVLFSIAVTMVVVGSAAWSAATHSAIKAEPQIDPLSLEANAKNLPSQEELNLKLWPQDAVAP